MLIPVKHTGETTFTHGIKLGCGDHMTSGGLFTRWFKTVCSPLRRGSSIFAPFGGLGQKVNLNMRTGDRFQLPPLHSRSPRSTQARHLGIFRDIPSTPHLRLNETVPIHLSAGTFFIQPFVRFMRFLAVVFRPIPQPWQTDKTCFLFSFSAATFNPLRWRRTKSGAPRFRCSLPRTCLAGLSPGTAGFEEGTSSVCRLAAGSSAAPDHEYTVTPAHCHTHAAHAAT